MYIHIHCLILLYLQKWFSDLPQDYGHYVFEMILRATKGF